MDNKSTVIIFLIYLLEFIISIYRVRMLCRLIKNSQFIFCLRKNIFFYRNRRFLKLKLSSFCFVFCRFLLLSSSSSPTPPCCLSSSSSSLRLITSVDLCSLCCFVNDWLPDAIRFLRLVFLIISEVEKRKLPYCIVNLCLFDDEIILYG